MIPHWILHFGAAGVFGVALFDASPIPLPIPGSTDLLILLLGSSGRAWLLALCAVVGTVIGGYLTWLTGKKGGEALFHHYMKKRQRWRDRITRWMRGHGIRTVVVATLLPPPFPLLPFLLAAGALGVTRRQLILALTIGRSIRYGTEAALTVLYGHFFLHLWNHYLSSYASPILYSFIGVMIISAIFGIWKFRRDMRQHHDAQQPQKEDSQAA
ncbi:MAG TPA: VTT domain-containing protein [Acidobacteriaceae bacterium]|nr:VTT domain-containing protein [Acidobacteriaceae bacterium]